MILVLSKRDLARPDVRRVHPGEIAQVLDLLAREEFDRVVVDGLDSGVNPFALARSLQGRLAPALVLAGDLRDDLRFWAERNGCHLAHDLDAALALEI